MIVFSLQKRIQQCYYKPGWSLLPIFYNELLPVLCELNLPKGTIHLQTGKQILLF